MVHNQPSSESAKSETILSTMGTSGNGICASVRAGFVQQCICGFNFSVLFSMLVI